MSSSLSHRERNQEKRRLSYPQGTYLGRGHQVSQPRGAWGQGAQLTSRSPPWGPVCVLSPPRLSSAHFRCPARLATAVQRLPGQLRGTLPSPVTASQQGGPAAFQHPALPASSRVSGLFISLLLLTRLLFFFFFPLVAGLVGSFTCLTALLAPASEMGLSHGSASRPLRVRRPRRSRPRPLPWLWSP